MLYQFSEFSYYSDKMIYSLMYLQQLEDKLEKEPVKCQSVSNLTDGSVQPVNRDPHGKWDVPQKPDPKDQSLRLSAPRLASRPLRVAEDNQSNKDSISDANAPVSLAPSASSPGNDKSGLTFGDVRRIMTSLSSNFPLGTLPSSDVLLTRAVVAKRDANLREGVGVQSAVKRAIPPGEVLEVIGASPGQPWLEVRHPVFGSGFISGDLVEPALVRVSKVISFDKGSSELTKEAEHGYRTKEDLLEGAAGRFVGTQPPFKTVVVVSYSAFDTFVIPGRTDIATFRTVCWIFASGSRLQSPALRDYLFR
jgi:hypothetical protein